MDITLKKAPEDPRLRALLVDLANLMSEAEGLAAPSFSRRLSEAQRQVPGSSPPRGDRAGILLCEQIAKSTGREVLRAREKVADAYRAAGADPPPQRRQGRA